VQAATNHTLGEGLLAEGDASGTMTRFEHALSSLAGYELPYEQAEVERRAAAAYVLAGDRPAGLHLYRSVRRAAIRLGARPFANGMPRRSPGSGKKVERRLGRLAASGLGRPGLSQDGYEDTRAGADRGADAGDGEPAATQVCCHTTGRRRGDRRHPVTGARLIHGERSLRRCTIGRL